MLDRIVRTAGPGTASPEELGISGYLVQAAAAPRFAFQRMPERPETAALRELTSRAIVGIADWRYRQRASCRGGSARSGDAGVAVEPAGSAEER